MNILNNQKVTALQNKKMLMIYYNNRKTLKCSNKKKMIPK